jgi:hypothetical protein
LWEDVVGEIRKRWKKERKEEAIGWSLQTVNAKKAETRGKKEEAQEEAVDSVGQACDSVGFLRSPSGSFVPTASGQLMSPTHKGMLSHMSKF